MSFIINHFESVIYNDNNHSHCAYKQLFEDPNHKNENVKFKNPYNLLKQEILNLATADKHPKILKSQIRTYQFAAIRALNYLDYNKQYCDYKFACIRQIIIPKVNFIIDFLEFLNEQFPNYFDENAVLPRPLFDRYTKRFLKKINLAKNNCSEKSKFDILYIVLAKFKTSKNNKCSFHEAAYMEFILDEIIKETNSTINKKHNSIRIIELLITHNLNSNLIYHHLINYTQTQLNQLNTATEKIDKLRLMEKKVFQIMDKKSVGYSTDKKCLKESILNWIKREVNYFDYNDSIIVSPKLKEKQQSTAAKFKIKTNLSVAQIACITKQLIDQKIFETDNKEATIKKISETLSSKNIANISSQSLRTKYFKPTHTTIEETKKLFLKLFKGIEKY